MSAADQVQLDTELRLYKINSGFSSDNVSKLHPCNSLVVGNDKLEDRSEATRQISIKRTDDDERTRRVH